MVMAEASTGGPGGGITSKPQSSPPPARLPTALSAFPPPRYISLMATATKKYYCMQCEMPEDKCECEKYCAFCQGQVGVRLCQDGLYYCPPCREACDYKASDEA
jgi:hypothetical protein